MKKYIAISFMIMSVLMFVSCTADSDTNTREKQEDMIMRGQEMIGVPSITRFTEKKLVKMLYELRDRSDLQTYTYLVAEQTGKLVFLGRSIGYGIPYATQFSIVTRHSITISQAEPNGLFSPDSAEGTWVMLLDGNGEPKPVYIEARIVVSQFPLNN